ncbi:MAG: tetratricopeptide (TPR) repeat protein [Maribacter sp.]|jgi:tetratricopeptide (TPR) repeat protein
MRTLFLFCFLIFPCFLFCQKISKKQKKKAAKYFKECIICLDEERYSDAVININNAITENPKELEYHISKITILFELDRVQEAIGYLNKTVDLFSDKSAIYNMRGGVMEIVRYFELAVKDFGQAIKYADNDKEKALYYSNRGASRSQLMDYEGAYEDLMNAYKLDGKNKEVLNNLAAVCDEVGRPEETLMYLNHIIELDSNFVAAYVNIGYKYQLMEKHEKAISYFKKAIKLDPKGELGYSNLSYSLMKIGLLEEALENINKSISLNSINPYAYRNRALIYLEKGNIFNACDDIDEGIEKGFSKSYGNELEELKKEHCQGTRN